MQLLIHALRNGMMQEQVVYQDLLQHAYDKRDALIKNDVNRLSEILQAEDAAMKRVRELNTMQVGTLNKIAESKGLPHTPNVSDVIDLLKDGAEKSNLQEVQQSFQTLIRDLRNQNEQNMKLLETQMQYNSFYLELLTQDDATVGDIYSNSGYVSNDSAPRRGFINREA